MILSPLAAYSTACFFDACDECEDLNCPDYCHLPEPAGNEPVTDKQDIESWVADDTAHRRAAP